MRPHRASFTLQGAAWMLLWALSFNTSMSLTKLLSSNMSTFMIVFVRLAFGLLFISPLIFKEKKTLFKTKALPLHLLRVIFTSTSMVCTYYAYSHLPLAFATSIGFTAPIFTAVLSVIALGDRLVPLQWFLIAMGYGGVLIMVGPTGGDWESAILVAFGANFFASCALICVKRLSESESTTQILVMFHLLGLGLLGALSLIFWKTPTPHDFLILLFIGGTATLSQFCIIRAMQNGDPSVLSPFEYSRLVIAIPIGMIFFEEIPTLWSIFGSLVIVMCTLFMTLYESKQRGRDRN